MKTYIAKEKDINRAWLVVDAKDKVLGRLAAKVASILRGKNKVIFSPHQDVGDSVIVINASRVKVTGNKLTTKEYKRFTYYPGGLNIEKMDRVMVKKPDLVIKHAVRGMLPKNKLGDKLFKKLKVYAGETHPHKAQNPKALEV